MHSATSLFYCHGMETRGPNSQLLKLMSFFFPGRSSVITSCLLCLDCSYLSTFLFSWSGKLSIHFMRLNTTRKERSVKLRCLNLFSHTFWHHWIQQETVLSWNTFRLDAESSVGKKKMVGVHNTKYKESHIFTIFFPVVTTFLLVWRL